MVGLVGSDESPNVFNKAVLWLRSVGQSDQIEFVAGVAAGESGGEMTESLFMKELKRRGISRIEDVDQRSPVGGAIDGPSVSGQARPGQAQPFTSAPPPPMFSGREEVPPQLQRSRELNSEGLEASVLVCVSVCVRERVCVRLCIICCCPDDLTLTLTLTQP
jgi:hypothetical protein